MRHKHLQKAQDYRTFTFLTFFFITAFSILLTLRESKGGYSGFIEALTFNISDRPFVPGIQSEQYPPPIFFDHYFGDLLYPWLDSKYLGGNFYFGLSETLSPILKRLDSYSFLFLLYLLAIAGAIAVSIILLRTYYPKGSQVTLLMIILIVANWPNIFAISRGQISSPINIIVVTAFLILLQSNLKFFSTNKRAARLLAIALGSVISIKVFGIFALVFIAFVGLRQALKSSVLPLVISVLLVLLPGTFKQSGFLYLLDSNGLYSDRGYYDATRNYNFSLQTIFVDNLGFTNINHAQWSTLLSVILSFTLTCLACSQYSMEEKWKRLPISSGFLIATLLGLTIPIAAPYVLGVYLIPLLIAVVPSENSERSRDEFFGKFNSLVNYYLLTLSILMISPSQFTITAIGDGFVGAGKYPYLIAFGVVLIFSDRIMNLITAKRRQDLAN